LGEAGLKLLSWPCSGWLTRNSMICPLVFGSGGSPLGNGANAPWPLIRMKLFPDWPRKSTMMSARSAGARNRCGALVPLSTLVGALRNPPSEPICQMSGPDVAVGWWLADCTSSAWMNRAFDEFTTRNR